MDERIKVLEQSRDAKLQRELKGLRALARAEITLNQFSRIRKAVKTQGHGALSRVDVPQDLAIKVRALPQQEDLQIPLEVPDMVMFSTVQSGQNKRMGQNSGKH